MSFKVYLFSFSKHDNSTAVPALNTGTAYDCILKAECSLLAPDIVLDLGNTSPASFNYAYIPDFGRYYFIRDWTFQEPMRVAHLFVDPLGTYKTQIGSASLYVLRAQNASNGYITDDYYPATTQKTRTNVAATWLTNPFVNSITNGYYVVGVVNNDSSAVGAVSYYVFTNAQFRTLCNALMGQTTWLGTITDVTEDFLKALYNPFEYIVSCMWFPFAPPLGTAVSDLPYGWYTLTGVSCRRLGASATTLFSFNFTVPAHPQAATRGAYLNSDPFRKMTLHVPFLGDVPLSSDNFISSSTLEVWGHIDCITGDAVVEVGNGSSFSSANRILLLTANLGVTIQLSQVAVDRLAQTETVLGTVSNIGRDTANMLQTAQVAGRAGTGSIGAAATVSDAFGVLGTVAHGIADSTRAGLPQMYTRGATGSFAWTTADPNLSVEFYPIVDEDIAHIGRPYCVLTTPSSLSGFMLIKTGDVAIPGTAAEQQMIRGYLESGFYYE